MPRVVRSRPPAILLLALLAACAGGSSSPSQTTSSPPSDRPSALPSAAAPEDEAVLDGEPWILFSAPSTDPEEDGPHDAIFLVRPDGTGLHRLVFEMYGSEIRATWSPDGSRVAYIQTQLDRGWGDGGLWVVNADGTNPHQVYDCSNWCNAMDYPDWGPDGAIYVSIDSNVPAPDSPPLTFEIWRVDPATGDAEAVLTRQDEMTVEQPRVSPDGSQLVYIRVRDIYEETGWAIFVADMTAGANGPERQLTDWDLFAATPDWSSDNWIAFNTNDLRLRNGEPHHVYRMAPDGRLEQLETFDPDDPTTPVEAAHPRWTADGRTMTFSLLLDGEPYLATMDADGSSQQLVPGPVWGGFSELRPVGD